MQQKPNYENFAFYLITKQIMIYSSNIYLIYFFLSDTYNFLTP